MWHLYLRFFEAIFFSVIFIAVDKNNFQRIVTEFTDMVYSLGLNYLSNTEDAEEITQDVFMKVFNNYDSFKKNSSEKTWIYSIAVRTCLDKIKANKTNKQATQSSTLDIQTANPLSFSNFRTPWNSIRTQRRIDRIDALY